MKMKFLVLSLVVTVLLPACTGNRVSKDFFENPVIRGDVADPSMIRIDDTYYVTGTSSEWAPYYPVFESEDLVNWTQTGHIFTKRPEWASSSFWAPELFYHNGTTYCYYTARRASDGISCIGVATADKPGDEFTDHGIIIEHGNEAIDAFVYDDDGQLYISWKAYGLADRPIEIIGSKLSADGLSLEGEPFTMLRDDDGLLMEGQYHFKQGGYYYILYAARHCCGPKSNYETWVARSNSFEGPYEKYEGNPILVGGEDYLSCGHGTAAETPDGRMFFICHAYMHGDGFYQGRQPILQEMYVGDDGWVHFKTGVNASAKQPMPFRGVKQKPVEDFVDNFDGRKIDPAWSWNYIYSDIDMFLEDGKLHLSGKARGDNYNGTVLCVRPQSVDYSVETKVSDNAGSLQGLTMYGDSRNLLVWAIGDGKLVLRKIMGREGDVLAETDYDAGEVYLKMFVSKGRFCEFFWSGNGEDWLQVEVKNTDPLTQWDRVARPGLIYNGPADEHAEFRYFKMTIL